jgi:hypothetical protein
VIGRACIALLAGLAQVPAAGSGAVNHKGFYYSLPPGWISGVEQGRFLLTPAKAAPDAVVIVILSGAESLGGRSFDEWLRAKMAADLSGGLKLREASAPQRGHLGALETRSAGRTVQDASGGMVLQIYYAVSDGRQAGVAMAAAGSEGALQSQVAGVQTVFHSLRFTAAPNTGAAPAPPAAKTEITAADVVGAWGNSSASYTDYVNSSGQRTGSSTISWGDAYDLREDGTYSYTFGGMVDGRVVREKDTGTWRLDAQSRVIAIRSATGRRPKDYVVLSYQTAPDGTVFMTVLDTYYPRTKESIAMWAERWAKKGRP